MSSLMYIENQLVVIFEKLNVENKYQLNLCTTLHWQAQINQVGTLSANVLLKVCIYIMCMFIGRIYSN